MNNFEDFLRDKHAKEYIGHKDEMVDAFEDWLSNIDTDKFLVYGDLFAFSIRNALSKPSVVSVEPLDFNFKCGCLIRVYLSNIKNDLNAGLSCCSKHEHPYAKTEDFYLSQKGEYMDKKAALEILIEKYDQISNSHGKENEFSQALLIAINEIKNYIKDNDQNS